MSALAAGSLNKRVTIQRKVSGRDSWGQPVDTWSDVATVWANVRTQTGRSFVDQEAVSGGLEFAQATTSIRIRKRRDVEPTMRVLYAGRVYEIKAVLPDEEGDEYLDIAVAAIHGEG